MSKKNVILVQWCNNLWVIWRNTLLKYWDYHGPEEPTDSSKFAIPLLSFLKTAASLMLQYSKITECHQFC